jgi:hypothetical protein
MQSSSELSIPKRDLLAQNFLVSSAVYHDNIIQTVSNALELRMGDLMKKRGQNKTLLTTAIKNAKKDITVILNESIRRSAAKSHCSAFEDNNRNFNETLSALDKIENCWDRIIELNSIADPESLISKMHTINQELTIFETNDRLKKIYEAFFHMDDITRGLLKNSIPPHMTIIPNDAFDKYINCLIRQMVRSIHDDILTSNCPLIRKTFERIEDLPPSYKEKTVSKTLHLAVEKIRLQSLETMKTNHFFVNCDHLI